jgi:hypothetical protein
MISTHDTALMPDASKLPGLPTGPSVVALSALVVALFLHGNNALAQSGAGATESHYSSSAIHESWETVAPNDEAVVAPSSAAAGVVAVPPYGQKARRASTVPSPGWAMTRTSE